jgi:transposase
LAGRPPASDEVTYKRRNVVERCFNRFEQYRAVATRYDKTATSYQPMIDLAVPRLPEQAVRHAGRRPGGELTDVHEPR